ncbi:MAG: hypothetical protein K6E34_14055 [Lachnospiraceae bacterium]|nr:hypothetical protein [Lachnospiraceae bacterium]
MPAVIALIYPEGNSHDGFYDAYNTAMLFKKLQTEKDFRLNEVYRSAKEEQVVHLGFSMGDILSGLKVG